jgi:hypothetical protein
MNKPLLLNCPACTQPLELCISYNGADWNTEAGEGTGYHYPVSLTCNNSTCGNVYTLGHLKSLDAFSKATNKNYL